MPDEIEQLKQESAQLLEQWKRAAADYENLQKDLARQQQSMRVSVMMHAALTILPAYDHLCAAFDHVPEDPDGATLQWIEGIRHIKAEYASAIAAMGLVEISATGKADPMLHEIVGTEPQEGLEEETILRVVAHGYRYNGAVVRPARVIVVKN